MQGDDSVNVTATGVALFAITVGGLYLYRVYRTSSLPLENQNPNPHWSRPLPNPYPHRFVRIECRGTFRQLA